MRVLVLSEVGIPALILSFEASSVCNAEEAEFYKQKKGEKSNCCFLIYFASVMC